MSGSQKFFVKSDLEDVKAYPLTGGIAALHIGVKGIRMLLRKFRIFLEMIKFEHTIFALPFAFMGAVLGSVVMMQACLHGSESVGLC